MKQRKYTKGRALTFPEAVRQMSQGRYVMLWERPIHPGWGLSMQARVLLGFCLRGAVCAANINPKWKAQKA